MAVGSSNSFDLIVLGAGTGGYAAAFRASQLGLRVALVDEGKIGGTCLHRGCIPTKALLESAAVAQRVAPRGRLRHQRARRGGDRLREGRPAARHGRQPDVEGPWQPGQEVQRDVGRGPGPARGGAQGAGQGDRTASEVVLEATDVILATGSRVKSLPGITPDGERIVTSDDVLRMSSLPASVIVIGAGAVGVEFASFYHDMGAAVTLLEYLPAIVPLEDAEVSRELERTFTRRGMRVMTGARFDPASVVAGDGGVRITVGPEGGPAEEIARRGAAGGDRARDERRGRGPRDHGGRGGPRHRQGGRPHADPRAAPVRHRRHRRRAPAGAHRGPRGDHRGPRDRRRG